jgi:hypothetical protein
MHFRKNERRSARGKNRRKKCKKQKKCTPVKEKAVYTAHVLEWIKEKEEQRKANTFSPTK